MKTEKISVSVDKDLLERIKIEIKCQRRSRSSLINVALVRYFEELDKSQVVHEEGEKPKETPTPTFRRAY